MKRTGIGTGIAATFAIAAILAVPAASASPLRVECDVGQDLSGRALVCEYAMLGRLNERFADLHDEVVRAGKGGRLEHGRWLAARDACRDVECLDRLLEAGIGEARRALVDVESRQPAPILASARGVPLYLVPEHPARQPKAAAAAAAAPEPERRSAALNERHSARDPSGLEPLMSVLTVLFFAGVAVYSVAARRLAA